MRVLVTGGAGYIGSHTCKALARSGHFPVTFDNLSRGHADAVRWGPLVVGDILDQTAVLAALELHEIEAVIHMAGLAYVGESMAAPQLYYLNNVSGSLAVFEAMRQAGVKDVVFSSSCATYGVPETLPVRESFPQNPVNTCGMTKLIVERMLHDYMRAHGFRGVVLRYFNAAGADADGELGERHEPETHALPLAVMAALGLGPPFQVLGTDYPTEDGSAVRDYVHVDDLAAAHVRAVERVPAGRLDFAYNLATGSGVSVRRLLEAVARVTGREVPAVVAPRRPGDPAALYADCALARRDLDWSPRFTDVEDMARTAARWFLGHAGDGSGDEQPAVGQAGG
jgi:UDP-arabinose 4-epimerase